MIGMSAYDVWDAILFVTGLISAWATIQGLGL